MKTDTDRQYLGQEALSRDNFIWALLACLGTFVFSLVFILICYPSGTHNIYGPDVELTDPEKALVSTAVGKLLFDPYSAHYEWPLFKMAKSNWIYCGSVNARNRFGAYVGLQKFAVLVDPTPSGIVTGVKMMGLAEGKLESVESNVVHGICTGAGYFD